MNEEQFFEDKLYKIYNEWLLEFCSDEIHCKDDLINKVENDYMLEEFTKSLKGVLE